MLTIKGNVSKLSMPIKLQKCITLILFCIVWYHQADSQTLELGLGLGVSAYDGDFLSRKTEVVKTMAFAGQLQLTYHFDERWRGQLFYSRGKVSAADEQITGNARNLSFATNINEGGLRVLYNFIPFDPYGRQGRKFTFFAGTGVTGYHFNPYTINHQGQKIFLREIGTAGQLIESEEPKKKPYNLFQIGVPFTIGASVAIHPQVVIGLEFDYRLLFTDYFDDLGQDPYPDFDELLLSNEQAALLIHRGWEKEYEPGSGISPIDAAADYYQRNELQNQLRAIGNQKDAFGFFLFKVSYLLEDFSLGGNRKFGCYNF